MELMTTTKEKQTMKQTKLPHNWDDKRVQQVIAHYENQTADEATDEDEAIFGAPASHTVMEIPHELVPVVRALLAKHSG